MFFCFFEKVDDEIKKLLEENLMYARETNKNVKSVKRMLMFDQVMTVVKILLVVLPLIWGILYLAPYIKQATGMYQELLGGSAGGLNLKGMDIGNMLKK